MHLLTVDWLFCWIGVAERGQLRRDTSRSNAASKGGEHRLWICRFGIY